MQQTMMENFDLHFMNDEITLTDYDLNLYEDLFITPSLVHEPFLLAEDLQKNLLKDVFFSPAINEPTTQTGDDTFSLASSSSSLCSQELHELDKRHRVITKKTPSVHKKSKRSKREHNHLHSPENKPRSVCKLYQTLTRQSIHWCRYCGTTEGVNWRPGPWGKKTLCNKHGCDYKGYGFASKLPRLDLTAFQQEPIEKRQRPVLQLFCTHCHQQTSWEDNTLVYCDGCPRSYHKNCYQDGIPDSVIESDEPWYCSDDCIDNVRHKRIIVELPRRKLPLMRTPSSKITSINKNANA